MAKKEIKKAKKIGVSEVVTPVSGEVKSPINPVASGLPQISADRLFRRNLVVWSVLIVAGVLAYGAGLYQGSQFRMQRNVASEASK